MGNRFRDRRGFMEMDGLVDLASQRGAYVWISNGAGLNKVYRHEILFEEQRHQATTNMESMRLAEYLPTDSNHLVMLARRQVEERRKAGDNPRKIITFCGAEHIQLLLEAGADAKYLDKKLPIEGLLLQEVVFGGYRFQARVGKPTA
jgi:hypothetical protein